MSEQCVVLSNCDTRFTIYRWPDDIKPRLQRLVDTHPCNDVYCFKGNHGVYWNTEDPEKEPLLSEMLGQSDLYMGFAEGSSQSLLIHPSFESASAEAIRLAKLEPGKEFFILKMYEWRDSLAVACLEEQDDRREGNRRELVDHPPHYGGDTVYECAKVVRAWGLNKMGWVTSAMKYLSRLGKKYDGGELIIQDMDKAIWYIMEERDALAERNGVAQKYTIYNNPKVYKELREHAEKHCSE